MGIELRQIAPHDPVALERAEALRDEVEARQADNGAARATTGRNGDRGFEFVRLDTHERLREAIRPYERAGYRRIRDYNSNPRSNRWYEKSLREFP